MIHVILLSGGSGTRLWPLSNNARSKQFLKVLRDDEGNHISMVQRTFSMLLRAASRTDAEVDVTIATTEAQRYSIESQLPEGGYQLVIEPERRDTAPAIMLACIHLMDEQGADASDTVVVMPIDAYTNEPYYHTLKIIEDYIQSDHSQLILLGVKPTFPSTKYGYIVTDSSSMPPYPVSRFVEKPDKTLAADLVGQGAFWNCGVFGFKLGYVLDIASRYSSAVGYDQAREQYKRYPKTSFDYAVVEKARDIAMIPCDVEWKDLGTWNTLTEEIAEPISGRVVIDDGTCRNVHVINEIGIPMVVAGLEDAVAIATSDGILVSSKQESAYIKPLVEKAALSRPMFEQRRWGEYRVIDTSLFSDGATALTKELTIESGKQLSYQVHARRSEFWTVVSGKGEVVLNGSIMSIGAGSLISIPAGTKHAARAFEDLHIIEVQIGEILIEEDIERFGLFWQQDQINY